MVSFLFTRMLDTLVVLFLALTAVFGMMQLSGDPATLLIPLDASPEFAAEFRSRHGFDQPVWRQYVTFIAGAVQGDFGTSIRQTGTPALTLVLDRLPNSLLLSSVSIVLALAIALPVGAMAAVNANNLFDRGATVASVLFQSIPNFWLGIMLIIVFSVNLNLLPTGGIGGWRHVILPAVTLAAFSAARILRLTRSSMLEVLSEDYVRTARAKGLLPRAVIFRHAFKNALVPVITISALQFGHIFGSAVIVESIFSWPGLGRLIVQSIEFRDFSVVLVGVFFVSAMFIVVNFLSDLLYAAVDPQIRLN